MGWFDDDRFDPAQFEAGGGLYGRLLSLQPQQSFDRTVQGSPFPPVAPSAPLSLSGSNPGAAPQSSSVRPVTPQPASNWPRDDGQALNLRIGDYWMPQFGGAERPSSATAPTFGDRLNASFQSWAHTPLGNPFAALANGIAGFNSGQLPVDQYGQSLEDRGAPTPGGAPRQRPAGNPGMRRVSNYGR
jgi:hypothetical protein